MDDVRLAMLGDKAAQERLTDAGVLLMQGDCLELLKDIPDGSVDMASGIVLFPLIRCGSG